MCDRLTDKHDYTVINLTIHIAINALSRLRIERSLLELFCIDFLWFLCARRTNLCATNRSSSWHVNLKSMSVVTRYPPNIYGSSYFRRARLASSVDLMNVRHACLFCLLYIYRLFILVVRRRSIEQTNGAARCPQTIFCLVTSRYSNDDASFGPPEAFICERNSESDRFAILRPTRHFSILPCTNLAAMLTISHTVALPSCRDRDKSVTFSSDCYIFKILTILAIILFSNTPC